MCANTPDYTATSAKVRWTELHKVKRSNHLFIGREQGGYFFFVAAIIATIPPRNVIKKDPERKRRVSTS